MSLDDLYYCRSGPWPPACHSEKVVARCRALNPVIGGGQPRPKRPVEQTHLPYDGGREIAISLPMCSC